MNILLLEPDAVLAQTYAGAFKSRGHAVVVASTAQDAIIKADAVCYDLVVCELQLVSHSGIEFLYEFRSYRDWQNIPVIINSTVPPIEFLGSRQGLASELGINSYLYKPNTSLRQLLRAVEEVGIKYEAA